jgi:hypothetical protein
MIFITSKNTQAQGGDSAAMMKMWMDYMTPGNYHKMLAKSNGTWMEEATFWMAPGAPPTTSSMTAENKMIMGGRYQQSNVSGMVSGTPFEGMSIVGYDNAKKKFVSTWVDNMGTGVMYMEGNYNPAMKNITFLGKMIDPSTGKENNVREVFTIIDDNTQMIAMFDSRDGKEFKSMELKMKRKL